MKNTWQGCLAQLESELSPQLFNTWIRPLQASLVNGTLRLLAPNQFVLEQVSAQFQERIRELVAERGLNLTLEIGSSVAQPEAVKTSPDGAATPHKRKRQAAPAVDPALRFDAFIEGKSNRLARASSLLVSENMGGLYNPLLLYGGVGLGKTHLLHAIGNAVLAQRPQARVVYVSAERFVSDMVSALQQNRIDAFKTYYRNLDLLLVDDIQFLAGKERSQEEFFHVFNSMLESKNAVTVIRAISRAWKTASSPASGGGCRLRSSRPTWKPASPSCSARPIWPKRPCPRTWRFSSPSGCIPMCESSKAHC